MKDSEWAEGVYESFMETYDFITCIRENGTYYGNGGTKCVKGAPATKRNLAQEKKKAKAGDKTAAKNVAKMEKNGVGGATAKKAPKAKKPEKVEGGAADAPKKPGDFAKGGKLKGAEKDPSGADQTRQANRLRKEAKELKERLKKDPEDTFGQSRLKMLEKELKPFDNAEKTLAGVVKNVPKGTNVSIDDRGGINTSFKTPGGNTVTTQFTRGQFNFKVNNSFDAGSVKQGRAEEMAVARQVQRTFAAHTKSVPNGYVVKTSAHTDDGRGASRQRAYERMGFSKAKPGGTIYAKVQDGKVSPSNKNENSESETMLSFSEAISEDANWHQAIFGIARG